MSGHTPGPWTIWGGNVISESAGTLVMPEGAREHHTGLVAIVYGHHVGEAHHYTLDANVRLITEAPAMLALLRSFAAYVEGAYDGDINHMDKTLPEGHLWRATRALLARVDRAS